MAFQDHSGIPIEALGRAMARSFERDGKHPLFELEMGRVTEADFLDELRTQLAEELGHEPELHNFKELYFDALDPNEPMIELMARARAGGHADGDADQQRARVGAAVAGDAAGRRDLRAGRRLGLRRHCGSPTRRSTS